MRICIFCSANEHIPEEFFERTRELGKWAARAGHTIVFGGVNQGLMECVARAAHENGGRTIGVVPQIIESSGRLSDYVDVDIPCDNLSDRKQIMLDKSDVFIALPGGIGTLDEIFTIASAATIGYHKKPVILYSITDFWQPLVLLLDTLSLQGMIRGAWQEHIKVAHSLDDIIQIISLE
jgi:hypothetical protein